MIDGAVLQPATGTDPTVVALTTAQQAELAALYGDDQPLVDPHPDTAFTVLHVDGVPAGCIGLQPVAPGLGEIKRLYVEPSFRGWGLSHLLLTHLETQARAQGLTTLRLETGTEQHAAQALYIHHGYHPIPAYPPFTDEPASRCFAKDLS
ncbi:GCN5-related N-acetyltransferase [Kribbella flavida DSM 17836]|uniref:GCN5-related N-acetyltransferase n=1 Tax=Kribbella flavida (strain DSM 17836 / JCM 10339 / NBRC 14399) TaxID=479435 RepID=D2Q529_KRIFD|nr:GNAT family N-acetyltransferase [Kribbella flavida]ADB36040.1 GCN5-related N-acetyltransferase [Kribbella flavida DSM 17836]